MEHEQQSENATWYLTALPFLKQVIAEIQGFKAEIQVVKAEIQVVKSIAIETQIMAAKVSHT